MEHLAGFNFCALTLAYNNLADVMRELLATSHGKVVLQCMCWEDVKTVVPLVYSMLISDTLYGVD